MPYISQEDRKIYEEILDDLDKLIESKVPFGPGHLNFILTCICLMYIHRHHKSYVTFCEVEGALSHVSKEIYRRLVAVYESAKILENGDIKRFIDA